MRQFMFIVLALISAVVHAADKPNIIVIMADDLGYGDVSCNGATELNTPNIDKLAKNGLRFTSGYCSASTCTPTRYSFLTGRFAFRDKGTGIAPPNATMRIKVGTETIASLLKRAGYTTAVIGKWHLGLGEGKGPDWNGELKPGPLEIGFDHCYMLPTTNDRVPQVYVEDHRVKNLDPKDPLWVSPKNLDGQPTAKDHPELLRMKWSHGHNDTIHNGIGRIWFYGGGHSARFRDEDLGDEWVKQSKAWIKANKDKPFFLFFASHDIHVPRMPHERFQGKSGLGYRGDSILELDWCVGELIDTIEQLGLDKNTLIVFCSDNGPVLDDGYEDGAVTQLGEHTPSGQYRGGKYSIYEGGTRTPFVTYWPGRIKPGVSDQMVCTIDLASSMAALAGVDLPDGAAPDSFNVLGALLGEPGAKGRDHLLQQPNNGHRMALRVGDWKLLDHAGPKPYGIHTFQKTEKVRYQLYNLAADPAEKTNVADQHPEKVAALIKQMDELRKAEQTRP
ncbi:arylsulfatase [Planctomycetales bacterium ZRK34]|nr:arylsulfatase [Planctomycetales bacterium ZRK34]